MLVIIPMSGFGERFRRAGYHIPKPLIEVEGKTFVQHVYEMFSKEDEFIFICNQEHLENHKYEMTKKIKSFCPKGRIVSIKPHKLGPIHAVNQVINDYDDNREVIINYCDFTCYWDYKDFLKKIRHSKVDGALPSYKGFHPHSDGKTNYAYIKENNLYATDIQEKKPFSNDKTQEYASSGTYYFKSIKILKESISYVLTNEIKTNGEYYVSMCYKFIFNYDGKVLVYPLEHFMQWGTPQDFEEYSLQSRIFRNLIKKRNEISIESNLIIPMAGLGQRFKNEGYKEIKLLIKVSGKPMIIQALETLPKFNKYHFVINQNMQDKSKLMKGIIKKYEDIKFIQLNKSTNGQATTIKKGLESFSVDSKISIISCDNGYIIDENELNKIKKKDFDLLVWVSSNYPYAKLNPDSYGWVYYENETIHKVSVKRIEKSDYKKAVITGGFTFSNSDIFNQCYSALIENNNIVNGEYYADSLVEEALKLRLKCKLMFVNCYISWGTPKELKTFNYWKSCFDKWHSHPYSLKKDFLN